MIMINVFREGLKKLKQKMFSLRALCIDKVIKEKLENVNIPEEIKKDIQKRKEDLATEYEKFIEEVEVLSKFNKPRCEKHLNISIS